MAPRIQGRQTDAALARRALQRRDEHVFVRPLRVLTLDDTLVGVIPADDLSGRLRAQRAQNLGEPRLPVHERAEAVEADPPIAD